MGTKLLPGKGAHLHLNGDTLRFVVNVMDELQAKLDSAGIDLLDESDEADDDFDAFNKMLDEVGADDVFEYLKTHLDSDASDNDWQYESDKFGDKLFVMIPWKDGAYRITVVNSRGGLKLDIREWYDPNSEK